jgi:glycosyltransferase involved in cell wall biosynthesis
MTDPKCYVLVRGRNAAPYVERCLESILVQTYRNIKVLFVDDASDYSREYKKKIKVLLPKDSCVLWRKQRFFSLRNAYDAIHSFCEDEGGIVFNLDADDWLAEQDSIAKLVKEYQQHNWMMTYGSCYIWNGGERLFLLPNDSEQNKKYSERIIRKNAFRDYDFLPLHPRTWRVAAFKSIPQDAFLNSRGEWLRYCEDQAIFFPLLEKYPRMCGVLKEPLSVYNQANPMSDASSQLIESIKDELEIRRKPRYEQLSN